MNDSEIIKGLQRMSNEDPDGFSSVVLDLINRQQAEIDRLNIDLKAMRGAANSWKAEVQRICKKEFDNIEIDIIYACRIIDYIDKLVEEMGCNDG